ncbi:M4 family metallopeptidase [Cohnella silvisoli]|uniref:M4 family metallopeptidase n=1 Tax=Cohnella silvisoli TaxID=2873699 RepID=A0ABV1L240_9BACL|nr:M4 family metallopeptidase [Cohnella silvisoli]MCD9026452.1 M4 family metallopeptidase [Cohnella silvisoli]
MLSINRRLGKKVIYGFLSIVIVVSTVFSSVAMANEITLTEDDLVTALPQQSMKGILSAPLTSDQAVDQYLSANKSMLGFNNPNEQLELQSKTIDTAGQAHYLYLLQHDGIPVYGKYMRVHLNKGKRISEIRNEMTSEPLPLMPKSTTPSRSPEEAIQLLQANLEEQLGVNIQLETVIGDDHITPAPTASLIIYPFQGKSYLAYETKLNFIDPIPGNWVAYVDAQTGKILDKYSQSEHAVNPTTHNGSGHGGVTRELQVLLDTVTGKYSMEDISRGMYQTHLGEIVTVDANTPSIPINTTATVFSDNDAVDAHFYSGVVYEYYLDKFNRNSIDDKGMDIVSLVNYTNGGNNIGYDNAFWNGSVMVYGNGKGTANGGSNCFSCALDVVGHEMTHGVIERTANLEYRHQSGALNESFADIFGALIQMDFENTNNDWQIGEATGKVIRDLSNPSAYGQPATMNNFAYLSRNPVSGDSGGVHINSSIPSRAAYLTAAGIDLLGLDGKEILGQLSYDVLVNRLTPTSDFEDARDAFVSAGEDQYGANSPVVQKVKEAWAAVGLPYGQKYDITSFAIGGVESTWIDKNSMEVYVSVLPGTNIGNIQPVIQVSPGAVLGQDVTDNFSDGIKKYTVSSQGTTVEWYVIIAEGLPSLKYTWSWPTSYSNDAFFEVNDDNGTITNEISVSFNDIFNANPGDDLLDSGKILISPVPEGLVAHTLLANRHKLLIFFYGQAKHHSNQDDIHNLSIRFTDNAFVNYYEYQVANYYLENLRIDFKHSLKLTSISNTTATLEWLMASNATKIEILQSTDNGLSWSPAMTSTPIQPGNMTATVTNLTQGQIYYFKLVITGGEDAGESVHVVEYASSTNNKTPKVENPIQDQPATIGGADISIPLATVFTDPEGDNMTYTATSNAQDVATASLSESSLKVHPVGAGIATITVTVHDGHGHYVKNNFIVTVRDPLNRAPTVTNPIAAQSANVGGANVLVPLNGVFSDADGDILSYSVSSSATNVAAAQISGRRVVIQPLSMGNAYVSVMANDGHGHYETNTFVVTVSSTNRAPIVSNPISSKTATVGGLDVSVPLSGVFTDQDADPLTYTATSNATSIATVSVAGSTLTVHPISNGTASITVTADDGHGHTMNTTFTVTVSLASSGGGSGGTPPVDPPVGGGGGTPPVNPPAGGGGGPPPVGPPPAGGPPVVPPVIPSAASELKLDDNGVTLGKGSLKSEPGSTDNGTPTTIYKVDEKALGQAIEKLADSKQKSINIDLGSNTGPVEVKIPVASLANASKQAPNSIVSVKTDNASYDLPLSVLKLEGLASNLGTSADKMQLNISLHPLAGTASDQLKKAAESKGVTVIGMPIEYIVTVEANGKKQELNNFGNTYISRTITLTGVVTNEGLTAVLYDPVSGEMTFVPAVFEVIDGKTIVTIKRNGNSIYTIIENKKSFADIPKNFWASADIELLASKSIMKGVTASEFKPNGIVTRAEMASLLTRALGLSPDKKAAAFSDVKPDDWFAGAVGAAAKAHIMDGFSNHTFKPQQTITREQMCMMIQNALKFVDKEKQISKEKQKQILSPFMDNGTISSDAQASVASVVEAGIMKGYSADKFAPTQTITRAQAAAIIKRMLLNINFID